MERRRAFGYASVLWRSVVVDAPRPTKMGNIASPWRNDAAASHARAPLKHPIAYDLALRPRAAIFQCHGRLGWALIHPRNRVYVGCRRKPGGQISAPSRLLLTQRRSRLMFATLAFAGLRYVTSIDPVRCSSHAGIAIDNSTVFAVNQLTTGVPALSGLRSNPLNLSGSCQRREYSMSSVAFVVSVSSLARVSLGVRRVS